MDKIFTQEELFWLDDILPGTKIGRVRRLSAVRNVHMSKLADNYDDETNAVNKFYFIHFFVFITITNHFSATN